MGKHTPTLEDCPQCGEPTDVFAEGVCVHCCRENQRRLDEHNSSYDNWQRLTDDQRKASIRNAIAKAKGEGNG